MNYFGLKTFPQSAFKIRTLQPILPSKNSLLSARIIVSGFMPDHLDTVAYYYRHSLTNANITTSPIIHTMPKRKKWWVVRGPFVHGIPDLLI